ncbi:MAG: hypothetical protein JJ992_02865, partial [Planctomycetes bacterium]|nr:hypothetical protein [Planctomycetota bacterium]
MATKNGQSGLQVMIASLILPFVSFAVQRPVAAGGAVTIRTDFPGGNVAVLQNDGDSVRLAPDLRGDSPWFYWYFEVLASNPGRVAFAFPDKVAGFENGAIGLQGPAISTDQGTTWKWMGRENVVGSTFHYEFSKAEERVRFAVTIPYLQSD